MKKIIIGILWWNRFQKIKATIIYVEGDGVMVKTTSGANLKHNTDLVKLSYSYRHSKSIWTIILT